MDLTSAPLRAQRPVSSLKQVPSVQLIRFREIVLGSSTPWPLSRAGWGLLLALFRTFGAPSRTSYVCLVLRPIPDTRHVPLYEKKASNAASLLCTFFFPPVSIDWAVDGERPSRGNGTVPEDHNVEFRHSTAPFSRRALYGARCLSPRTLGRYLLLGTSVSLTIFFCGSSIHYLSASTCEFSPSGNSPSFHETAAASDSAPVVPRSF